MSTREDNRRNWEAMAGWSTGARMTDMEAVMWRAEDHPWLSSTILALELLDRAPDWDRLRAAHAWGARVVPRFRQRVVDSGLRLTPPAWKIDDSFDLDYHLRRVALPEDPHRTGEERLLAFAQTLALSPLDRSRPLWEAALVEGLEDGRAAYVLKSHHSLSDGIAGVQLFGGMHSRTREPTPDKPHPGPPEDNGSPSGPADDIRALLHGARSAASAATGAGGQVVGALGHPRASLAAGLRFGGSLRRVATPAGAPSPLFAGRRGRAWRFALVECPLDALKAAGRSVGGSLNDAYLAALLGGLRRYHEHFGVEIEELPVAVPVSLRRSGDAQGGNRFTAIQLAGPVGLRDPADRIAAIRGLVLARRAEPALDVAGLAAPLLSRLPAAASVAARGRIGAQADLSASNFPGLTEDVFLAGARVERIFAFGPLPGSAVMATLVSHQGVCCISLNCDGDAVSDPGLLRDCIETDLAEVLALG